MEKVNRTDFGCGFDLSALASSKRSFEHKTTRYTGVSTVGLNEATIAKYVREQQLNDQMSDKVSVKELEDPFRG